MATSSSRLGDLLIERKLLTSDQLEEAICLQKGSHLKLGEVLVSSNLVTPRQLKRTLKIQTELRKTILTTFMCLVPFQYASASETDIHTEYHPKGFSSPYQEFQEPKLIVSYKTVMQGIDYFLLTKGSRTVKNNRTKELQKTNYDVKFGKDNFSFQMSMSF